MPTSDWTAFFATHSPLDRYPFKVHVLHWQLVVWFPTMQCLISTPLYHPDDQGSLRFGADLVPVRNGLTTHIGFTLAFTTVVDMICCPSRPSLFLSFDALAKQHLCVENSEACISLEDTSQCHQQLAGIEMTSRLDYTGLHAQPRPHSVHVSLSQHPDYSLLLPPLRFLFSIMAYEPGSLLVMK
jgi:hypothetical protein